MWKSDLLPQHRAPGLLSCAELGTQLTYCHKVVFLHRGWHKRETACSNQSREAVQCVLALAICLSAWSSSQQCKGKHGAAAQWHRGSDTAAWFPGCKCEAQTSQSLSLRSRALPVQEAKTHCPVTDTALLSLGDATQPTPRPSQRCASLKPGSSAAG